MTVHIESKLDEIAKTVLMPGDPKRSEYIAKKYLKDYKLVNSVRGINAYTGYYKDKLVTVFPSGMGIPSMGIYSFELFHMYNVENIIRIGTCGALDKDMKMLDLILVDKTYTESNYALALDNIRCYIGDSSASLNETIQKTAEKIGINIQKRNTVCNEIYDPYHPKLYDLIETFPKELRIAACEMEAFSLFYNAKREWKNASCILSVVDTLDNLEGITAEERQNSLDTMIKLALESAKEL